MQQEEKLIKTSFSSLKSFSFSFQPRQSLIFTFFRVSAERIKHDTAH